MNQRLFSISILAAAWVAFNTAPTWAQGQTGQSQKGISQSQGAGQTQDKSLGGTKSQREPESGTPVPKEGGQADVKQGKEAKGGMAGGQWAKEDVKQAQEALKSAGHDPGPIDGIMGPQTQQALRAFQGKSGLKETGQLDSETAKKLKVEKGAGTPGAPATERGGAAKEPGREPTGAGKGQSSSSPKEPSPMGK